MRMASGSQSISCPVRKPRANDGLGGLSRPPRRFARGLDLGQCQPCVIEKRATRCRQLNAPGATGHQWDANLELQIPDLTA
jgi:hypothetical protein